MAREVTFGRPDFDRATLTFNFNDFTNISLDDLAVVTVIQDADFSIEVTADADVINDVQVSQIGDRVSFDLNDSRIYNAAVRMPLLNQIDVGDNALANVTLRSFDQMQMTVNLGGVSILRGEGLMIGVLAATVSGVSTLDLGDIPPIGNANIDIGGVSQATLNMAVGSTLAGSVTTGVGTGVSRLFYYGTDINLNVTTDAQSVVTRLGDTQP